MRRVWAGAWWSLLALWPATAGLADPPERRGAARGVAEEARALAGRIDEDLAERWARGGVRPAPRADDGEFLRRVCLDVVGKTPTAAEARDFLDDPSPNKRDALVDRLLDGPAYVTRATELWRQLLLPEADVENAPRQVVAGFEAWLRRKVIEEAGYDRIVREVLSARLARRPDDAVEARAEASPASYFAAMGTSPEKLAASASRVFLGVRLECAQCHDHPFAAWKREQFWGFAAFFAGTASDRAAGASAMPRGAPAPRELTIPGTSKVVQAAHLDGKAPAWRPRADGREVLADWLTAPDNPYFARAVVNRLWARFFGVGLVEPIDDLGSEGASEYSELLDEIAARFRDRGYDLAFLIRAITSTRAYHLTSASKVVEPSEAPTFAAMPVRGPSPEQLLESLRQATGREPGELRGRLLDLFSRREERPTEAQTSILQALTLMNGAYITAATDPSTGDVLGAVVKAPYLDDAGRIEALYLAALSRRPRPDELEALLRHVDRPDADARARAFGDLFWAILNGPEFLLNH